MPDPKPNDCEFTMDQKRTFVLYHIQQLADMQAPQLMSEYRRYFETAPEEWVNKSFIQFCELINK